MEPWVVILLVLIAIIGVCVYIAAKPNKPKPQIPERAQKERDVPIRKVGPNINVPSVTPINVDPVPSTTPQSVVRPDRLYLDGEEIDSKVGPAGSIPTKLTPLNVAKGDEGVLTLRMTAEPLANPADRAALKAALHKTGPPMTLPGAHNVIVSARPHTASHVEFYRQPTWAGPATNPEAVVRIEEFSPHHLHFLLFFWGDNPMEATIKIPYRISKGEVPAWAYNELQVIWSGRRETKLDTEWGSKVVEIE